MPPPPTPPDPQLLLPGVPNLLQALDDVASLPENDRRAFFINLYNAMIVHANIVLPLPRTTLQRLAFFDGVRYRVGGDVYSCNDIEHGVLRGNGPSPADLWVLLGMPDRARGHFKAGDPRLALTVPLDPRIHFALNCGARSCPPVRVFDGANVGEALRLAGHSFLDAEVIVREPPKGNTTAVIQVELSMILKWYRMDFGRTDRAVLETVHGLMEPGSENRASLRRALDAPNGVKCCYRVYDWGQNN